MSIRYDGVLPVRCSGPIVSWFTQRLAASAKVGEVDQPADTYRWTKQYELSRALANRLDPLDVGNTNDEQILG